MISRIEGLLLIPHELLHLAGYRLVGKQCEYQWGDHYVTPIGSMTRRERLVGLLFPFAICVIIGSILLTLSGSILYFNQVSGLQWSILLAFLATGGLIYAGAALGDLRQAYLLIFQPQQKTPFDWLFWPVAIEHRQEVRWFSAFLMLVCLVLLYISLA